MKSQTCTVLFLVAGLILSTGTLAPMATAREGVGEPDRVNGDGVPRFGPFITIWEDGLGNYEPAVAYNSQHDEYLVVWYTKQGPNTWDIWARRVGSDGSLKSWFNVATGASKRWEPAVAYSPVQDEYLIVYTFEVGASDYDILATRVKWDGSWKSAEFVIMAPLGIQWTPSVAYNSQNDEYLVVYANVWASGTHDIAAQRVDGDGTLLSWRNIATSATDLRSVPDVAYNAARNEYLIAYSYMQGSVLTQSDIRGKVASANMGDLSPQEIIICNNNRDQTRLAVAAGPDEYLVAWLDGVFGSGQDDVFARRLSGDGGVPLGPADGFPIAQFVFLAGRGLQLDLWLCGHLAQLECHVSGRRVRQLCAVGAGPGERYPVWHEWRCRQQPEERSGRMRFQRGIPGGYGGRPGLDDVDPGRLRDPGVVRAAL